MLPAIPSNRQPPFKHPRKALSEPSEDCEPFFYRIDCEFPQGLAREHLDWSGVSANPLQRIACESAAAPVFEVNKVGNVGPTCIFRNALTKQLSELAHSSVICE